MKHNKKIMIWCRLLDGIPEDSSGELINKAKEILPGGNVTAVIISEDETSSEAAYQTLVSYGADRVVSVTGPHLSLENEELYAVELEAAAREYEPDILLIAADPFGRLLAPGVSSRLATGLTADCTSLSIDSETGLLLQTRPAFGGNLYATMTCPDTLPQMATVRPGVFKMPSEEIISLNSGRSDVPFIKRESVTTGDSSGLKVLELITGDGDININDAKILVAVGRGAEAHIELAGKLADKLGGALAASRPLVDDGLVPYSHQVGQTGKTVSPDLYIAVGISGSAQHLAGLEAKKVAAVNTDPDAPIFKRADFGLVSDSGAFLRAALERLDSRNS